MEAGEIGAEGIDEEVGLEVLTGGTGGSGIITGNGASVLTPTIVDTYAALAGVLTQGALTVSVLESNELITSTLGRVFLDYLTKCALPSGESLTVSHLGSSYTFAGHVGLTPHWLTSALSTSDRRWLSACLLAHVNLTTSSVSILLQGNHPALSVPVGTAGAPYTLREGAFYGNVFGLVQKKYACEGDGTTSSRVCAQGGLLGLSTCGFSVPGDCYGSSSDACQGLTGTYYNTCHSGLILPLTSTTAYPETITVYLVP
jgi:hypothetical protein